MLDTNVFIAALKSQYGASHRLLMLTGLGRFTMVLSVPLVLEYEAVASRMLETFSMGEDGMKETIGYLCGVAEPVEIHFLWRPLLGDPKDDMVLELAVAGRCDCIVTHNIRDFGGASQFGVDVMTPRDFLRDLGELK